MNRITIIFLLLSGSTAYAQQVYMTRNGQISFYSETPVERIDAVNNEVTSLLNTENGELVFAVLIKSFHFERALMEEHFNENYMESDKIPKATFQGKITNLSAINFSKDGVYTTNVTGDLTIHGVRRSIETTGSIRIEKGKIIAASEFQVNIADFNIEIPSLVADKIEKTLAIRVNCNYQPKS